MDEAAKIEKFPADELAVLRGKLMNSRNDSWQAAEVVSDFLAGRGYGASAEAIRAAVPELAAPRGSEERMQSLLETVAWVM
jgi:hypothetical protein